jgi:arylformamidase
MKTYDISVPIEPGMVVWEGDPPVSAYRTASLENGDIANVTRLDMGAHTGTHIDAPLHFLDGRPGADRLDLDTLIGPAQVREFRVEKEITAGDLEAASIPAGTLRLLCKTSNSRLWSERPNRFTVDFVGISASGAEWLVERGIRLVGIDYLGIERAESVEQGAPVHHVLLGAGAVILEGLDLSEVPEGEYQLICLPLKIKDSDGAPCRAVLRQGS